jgi:hypothetical protein
MTCALTALLISPISWDHHWVWLAPALALLIDAGHRASRAWYALAAATWAVFAAWPDFWSAQTGLLQGGLTGYAPATAWAHGDNPAYAEYHWHGPQLQAPRATQCRSANVAAVAALGRLVCPVCRVRPRCARGHNVETPHYMELSHVPRVLYLQVVQNFQDH